jgi:hypothetical protein
MVIPLERNRDFRDADRVPRLADAPDTSAPTLACGRGAMPNIEPPGFPGAPARLTYPGCAGSVFPYTDEMLATELMSAYPWDREHGWSASN